MRDTSVVRIHKYVASFYPDLLKDIDNQNCIASYCKIMILGKLNIVPVTDTIMLTNNQATEDLKNIKTFNLQYN